MASFIPRRHTLRPSVLDACTTRTSLRAPHPVPVFTRLVLNLDARKAQVSAAQTDSAPLVEAEETKGAVPAVTQLTYGVSSVQGPRELMEDCAKVIPNGKCGYLYALVFDGHSGIAAAEWLNNNMYNIICDAVTEDVLSSADFGNTTDIASCPMDLHEKLAASFFAADKVLLQYLDELPDEESRCSGATATISMITKDHLIVANVGDSRAVLCRKGKAVELTAEHRVYGRSSAVIPEVERIEAAGGWVRDGRVLDILGVSRTFGDRDFKGAGLQRLLEQGVREDLWNEEFAKSRVFTADPIIVDPDVVQMNLAEEDEFLIIATDGLWDVFSSEDAVALTRKELLKGTTPQEMADKLTQFAVKRYTADNVAAVVVDLGICNKSTAAPAKKGGLFGGLFG